ncbi:hypothetical protein RDI58_020734 [Solanum bulbocastanum]|uniref:Uncharacterized protein n=1 Tax=Solanum bulbocastanum TaxID=147425 RepID=A0AAN8YAZ1_SOLBU
MKKGHFSPNNSAAYNISAEIMPTKKKLRKAFEDDRPIIPCDILFSIFIRLPVKSLLLSVDFYVMKRYNIRERI